MWVDFFEGYKIFSLESIPNIRYVIQGLAGFRDGSDTQGTQNTVCVLEYLLTYLARSTVYTLENIAGNGKRRTNFRCGENIGPDFLEDGLTVIQRFLTSFHLSAALD